MVRAGWLPPLQVLTQDVRVFDSSPWKGRVDCVHAGFPCQPHSVAGKRKGGADHRNLWPETRRIIGEIRPPFAFLENVPGIVSNGYVGVVLGNLAKLGYDARWTVLGADQVGAPHRRDRWWCVAYPKRGGGDGLHERVQSGYVAADFGRGREDLAVRPAAAHHGRRVQGKGAARGDVAHADHGARDLPTGPRDQGEGAADLAWGGAALADAQGQLQRPGLRPRAADGKRRGRSGNGGGPGGWWLTESNVGRVAYGVASRDHRLSALGDGQVPLQAAAAWLLLKP